MDRVKAGKITEYLRMAIQVVFFIVFPSAFASAFTAVKEVATAFSTGAQLTMTPFSKILIFLLAFTVIFGRFFCGYACALGAFGDWVYKTSQFIQRKTGKKIPKIPMQTVKTLQHAKFIVLALIIILCFSGFNDEIGEYSPWTLFSMILSGKFPIADYIEAGVLLLLIVIGMAIQSRFFCQFLCPMGAIFSMMPVLPTGQLVRDSENCIKCCKICRLGCPVALKLGKEEFREGECVRCNRCISLCPRGNISLGCVNIRPSGNAWVIFQAALLLIVLKFVI